MADPRNQEIGIWTSISVGSDCIGAFLNCGELGVEAYDADDVLLGVFADEDDADNAIFDCWESRTNGGNPHARAPEPEGITDEELDGWANYVDPDMEPMLAAALSYAETRHWDIFPADTSGKNKKSYKSAQYSNGAKWGKTRDPEQIRKDFRKWPEANIGLPTGKNNGFWVLEADTLKGHNVDGIASLRALEKKHGALPKTLMAESPSSSLHHYFNWPEGLEIKNASGIAPGVDVRGEGGMVIAPPSVRDDGEYRWLNSYPIADAPQWLLELVSAKPRSSDNGAAPINKIEVAPAFQHLDPHHNLNDSIDPSLLRPSSEIAAALAVIPNDDCDWENWNKVGMAVFAASGGSDEGFALFDRWSQKSSKYNADHTARKWGALHGCPPTSIGFGSLAYWANQADPSWLTPSHFTLQQTAPPLEPSFVDPYAEFAGPPFPLEVLPPTLAKLVEAEHRAMGADPSALAMAALTSIAEAIDAETLVKAGEGWWERPILWTCLIGPPSAMKTPIFDKAKKPLSSIDHEQHKIWQASHAAWRQTQPETKKNPPPPKPPRHIINDATPEKTAEILSRSPRGSLVIYDELAGWIGGFERYNQGGSTRAFYLTSWNGGTFLKDRVGKGRNDQDAEIRVENLALCILGGIQSDKLAQLGDLTSDGLLQRFLPCLMKATERGDEYHPVAEAEAAYDKMLRLIADKQATTYLFDKDALEVRDRVNDELFQLKQVDGFSSALISAIGKLRGYFARICLVLEVARQHDPMTLPDRIPVADAFKGLAIENLAAGPNYSKSISRETAEAAEKVLRQFLLPHILGLYDVILNGGQDRDMIRAIGDFILTSTKDRLRPSDFTNGIRALRGQPEQKIREWMGRFCAMDWLEAEEIRLGVPPKAWLVVPGLREHFTERRKRVEAARRQAHAILKAGGPRGP
jgi:hypothetical protein